ncbi:MAG: hypothetical protein EPO11_04580 [Gammaproteobacteria bacterium]|nr:MAG: hypothetical protein EPO11_04580 [Gammaproteobacteria bacterium]
MIKKPFKTLTMLMDLLLPNFDNIKISIKKGEQYTTGQDLYQHVKMMSPITMAMKKIGSISLVKMEIKPIFILMIYSLPQQTTREILCLEL